MFHDLQVAERLERGPVRDHQRALGEHREGCAGEPLGASLVALGREHEEPVVVASGQRARSHEREMRRRRNGGREPIDRRGRQHERSREHRRSSSGDQPALAHRPHAAREEDRHHEVGGQVEHVLIRDAEAEREPDDAQRDGASDARRDRGDPCADQEEGDVHRATDQRV